MEIILGEKYRDSITNFEGIAVAKCEYLYGCKQTQLEGVDSNGEPKTWWFDNQRITEMEEKKPEPEYYPTGGGGPQAIPPDRNKPGSREHPSSMTSSGTGMTLDGD